MLAFLVYSLCKAPAPIIRCSLKSRTEKISFLESSGTEKNRSWKVQGPNRPDHSKPHRDLSDPRRGLSDRRRANSGASSLAKQLE